MDNQGNIMKETMDILQSTFNQGVPQATEEIGNMCLFSSPGDTENFTPPEGILQPQTSNQNADTSEFLSPNDCQVEGDHRQIDSYAESGYHVASPMSPESVTQPTGSSCASGLTTTLAASSSTQDSQNLPQLNILEITPSLRFRYDSESKRKTPAETDGNSARPNDVSLGKIELINVKGEFELKMKLVTDLNGSPHANQLLLDGISKKEGYSQQQDGVLLRSCQKETQRTYELPKCKIMRAKKNSSELAKSVDCRRVRVMFDCYIKSTQYRLKEKISDEIIDSKGGATDSGTTLVHVNPSKTQFSTSVEVTLLGNNITTKHQVLFYRKGSMDLISEPVVPIMCHKKSAVVVMTPLITMFEEGTIEIECEIALRSNDGESNRMDFTFYPDLISRPGKRKFDDEGDPSTPKEKIRQHLMSKKGRQLQPDSGAGEQDQEEARIDDDVHQIAFDVAQGEIQFDKLLCQRLGMCPEAMLQKDDCDYTPLALAITSGALNVAEALLSRMPPLLADDLLKQRLTDAYVTHLLLMAFWPDGEPPLSLLKTLLEAGSDPEALDTEGNSLLHLLIRNEKYATLEAILSGKDQDPLSKISAMLNHTNRAGFAPLHEAMYSHQPCTVAALVSAGANVNVVSRSSQLTCLHYAALESDTKCAVEMTRLLLTGPGLKINERTLEGKTATDIAEERENQELLDLLKSNGGVNLYEPCSEDEESDEEEKKEVGATATAPQPSEEESVSLEEAHQQLLEALSAEDFRALGRDLLSAAQNRLLERASGPGPVFLRLVASARRKGQKMELAAALRRLELVELAELVSSARVT